MSKIRPRTLKVAIPLAAQFLLAACSGPAPTGNSMVEQVYNSPGVVNVPPYTRSIFSSTNF